MDKGKKRHRGHLPTAKRPVIYDRQTSRFPNIKSFLYATIHTELELWLDRYLMAV